MLNEDKSNLAPFAASATTNKEDALILFKVNSKLALPFCNVFFEKVALADGTEEEVVVAELDELTAVVDPLLYIGAMAKLEVVDELALALVALTESLVEVELVLET